MRADLAALSDALASAVDRRAGGLSEADEAVLRGTVAGVSLSTGPTTDRMSRLAEVFGLTDLDRRLLVTALAPEIDLGAGLAAGLLNGVNQVRRFDVDLAFELAGVRTDDATARARVRPDAPLVRHGLLRLEGDGVLPARRLRVPDRVVSHLLGDDTADELTQRMAVPTVPLEVPGVTAVAEAVATDPSFCYVHGRPGSAATGMAVAALGSLRIAALAVDLTRRGTASISEALTAVLLDAGLLGRAVVLLGVDEAAEEEPQVFERVVTAPVPVVAVGASRWDPSWLRWLPLCVEAPQSTVAQRREVWATTLARVGDDLEPGLTVDDLASLNLTPVEIAQVVSATSLTARSAGRRITAQDLRQTTRRLGAPTAGGGLHRRDPGAGFDDLVLPETTMSTLRELVGWARVRDSLVAETDLTGKGGKGGGIMALFTGSPGTGKTLAAHVVASEVGMDLQTVDLSVIIDKYVGETEKHLERVFAQAESMNCVLFFDEADALFGGRSAVRDSHDRHANQQVAYLLQRMEAFDGIGLLSTNLRGNLDPAFLRRLHFVVPFPNPLPATRRELWSTHLASAPRLDPHDPVDLDLLAEGLELTGGEIRNVVLTATFNASTHGEDVGMRHVVIGVLREYQKLARLLPAEIATAFGGDAAEAETTPPGPAGIRTPYRR